MSGHSPILVLIVDDCPDTRAMLCIGLEAHGVRCESAESGTEALRLVASLRPDALVLDLGLPDIDGTEVCRRLRSDPATKALPILVLTAHARISDRQRAGEAGCDQVLVKPVDLRQVCAALDRLIPGGLHPS